jgi:hypothetical protein
MLLSCSEFFLAGGTTVEVQSDIPVVGAATLYVHFSHLLYVHPDRLDYICCQSSGNLLYTII